MVSTQRALRALNRALRAGIPDKTEIPEEQSDAKNMSLKEMNNLLKFHQIHNRSETRSRYVTYWKEQIANRILLEEMEKSDE